MLAFLLVNISSAEDVKFFPKSSIGGYLETEFAAPHNEWDLNRCAPNAGIASNGGPNAPCTAFARAALGGYLELKPINAGPFKRLYVFVSPRSFFGDNLPQTRYSFSLNGIGMERENGLIYILPHGFEATLTQHAKIYWFGKYQKALGAADLHNSPYGQFNSIGVRWKFGSYRSLRSH
jgi:hypothetical protein